MPGVLPVGLRQLVVGEDVRVVLAYPAQASAVEEDVRLGPFVFRSAPDAPADLGSRAAGLVVVSHGTGSSPLLHRGLAVSLASRGFVVALVWHPRNNRQDDSLAGTAEILVERPRHVVAALDGSLAALPDLAGARVAVVGHSLGGYTALALAGGEPTCFPHEDPDGVARRLDVVHDDRVSRLVLLAPATPWFMGEGALAAVRVPVLTYVGEHDTATPAWHADIVARGVGDPALVDTRVVPAAGHFSFLAPFPAAMTRPDFPPSVDPPGFDRPAFHVRLYDEIAAFLA